MSLNALIVDDEELIRKMIIRSLKDSGLVLSNIFQASNGKEAWKILNENKIDFALVDLQMPVMTGLQLVEKIRRDPDFKLLPVIFISGEKDPEQIEPAIEAGLGFIRKPFDPARLAQTVMNLIAGMG